MAATRIQHRRGTAEAWLTANPVLEEGELGLETDTGIIRFGNGTLPWADLAPSAQAAISPTAAEWQVRNPILGDGIAGIERDTKKIKVGDGVTLWNNLAYTDASVFATKNEVSSSYIKVTEGPLPVAKFSDQVVDTDNWTQAIRSTITEVAVAASGGVKGAALQMPQGLVRITDTIEMNQQAVTLKGLGRGSGPSSSIVKWSGAPGIPMFRLLDYSACAFEDMSLIGNATNPPSVGILSETPGAVAPSVGTNEHLRVSRVAFGRPWTNAPVNERGVMGKAIHFGGTVDGNNDQYTFEDLQAHDCTVAAWHIDNVQATWGSMRNLFANQCAVGLWTRANLIAINMMFNRCGIDVQVRSSARAKILGYFSEHSSRLWDHDHSTTLDIDGGKALLNEEMEGLVDYANSVVSNNGGLLLRGLLVVDNTTAQTAKLHINGSSSNTVQALVNIEGCVLPRGDSDSGYDIDGYAAGTELRVRVRQGAYRRDQVVKSLNAPGRVDAVPSRQLLGTWNVDGAAASQTDVSMPLSGLTTATQAGNRIQMVRDGSITGIVIRSNTARTAGTLTAEVTKNGVGTGLIATINDINTLSAATTQDQYLDTFNATDQVGVRFTTSADWTPGTADIVCNIEIVS